MKTPHMNDKLRVLPQLWMKWSLTIKFLYKIYNNNIQKRFLLFLFGCIGTRVAFAYVAKKININYLPIMGYFALIPTIGLCIFFFIKYREKAEVFDSTRTMVE